MVEISLKSSDLIYLSVSLFEVVNPKGVIQIIPGYKEHKERYYDFVNYLNANNFNVIISDIRGHGKSISGNYKLGYVDDYEKLIEDQNILMEYVKNRYSNLPLYLIGDSIGANILLSLIQKYDNKLNKVVLCSPVYYKSVNTSLKITNLVNKYFGSYKTSGFLKNTLKLENLDLLFKDVNAKSLYKNDELCSFDYYNLSVLNYLLLNKFNMTGKYQALNKNLPIFFNYGDLDLELSGKNAVNNYISILQKNGYSNIKFLGYANMEHKILFEPGKKLIYDEILKFLNGA